MSLQHTMDRSRIFMPSLLLETSKVAQRAIVDVARQPGLALVCHRSWIYHRPLPRQGCVTSQDLWLQKERKQMCALHSCIENLGNFRVFV
jgi:hypothetical protein